MYKKIMAIVFAVSVCAVLLTTCRQSMIKQLQASLLQANIQGTKLFGYNPDLELIPTQSPQDNLITISAHGYGANKKTGKYVAQYAPLTGYVLTLNLPDHDHRENDRCELKHGCIDEILPVAYAVKTAISAGAHRINLYGFSAGGGAVINLLVVLYTDRFDTDLQHIGITESDKAVMIQAIKHGVVLLDVPLKSVEEIMHDRGQTEELKLVAHNYTKNKLRPIDSLDALQGLGLTILLYFENPDEILYNRDDAEFIQRLKKANDNGSTRVVVGSNGGHNGFHKELWISYAQLTKEK